MGQDEPSWRQAPVVLCVSLGIGFLLWGQHGQPWLIDFGAVLNADALTHWQLNFVWGALVMVVLPLLALRFVSREAGWAQWGLGLGDWRKGLGFLFVASAVAAVAIWFVGGNEAMRATYPLFGHQLRVSPWRFAGFALSYLLFFCAGDISMRGLLLFATHRFTGSKTIAVVLSTLPQIVWHLGKPIPELLAAPVWGIAIGYACLRLGSVWYALVFHWLANVWLDVVLYYF